MGKFLAQWAVITCVLAFFPFQFQLAAAEDATKSNRDYGDWNTVDDDARDIAVGVIVAIVVGIIVFLVGVIIVICFLCTCCCFAGRRKTGGAVHTHVHTQQGVVYPHQGAPAVIVYGNGNAPYPQNGQYPQYPQQPIPDQGYYGNAGANPGSGGTPNYMKPHQPLN